MTSVQRDEIQGRIEVALLQLQTGNAFNADAKWLKHYSNDCALLVQEVTKLAGEVNELEAEIHFKSTQEFVKGTV